MPPIAVIGAGAWGTALAIIAAKLGHDATLIPRHEATAARLREQRQNARYLLGATFPENLTVDADGADAIRNSAFTLVAVPSVYMRATAQKHRNALAHAPIVVSATKGLEIDSGMRMSEVINDVLATANRTDANTVPQICALSGPNLAAEISRGLPALATVAANDIAAAELVQQNLSGMNYRLYASTDIIGVELGGTLKNVIGIGAGVIDAAELGANAKASYVTRGISEMTRLGVAMGAQPATFAGLSGVGDALATCYSTLSRNYRLGALLGSGLTLTQALDELGQTAEGVPTTSAAVKIAQRLGVELPITQAAHKVLFEGTDLVDAISALMQRDLVREA